MSAVSRDTDTPVTMATFACRYADNILKSFATSMSIVVTGLISYYAMDDFTLSAYVTLPPPLRVHSFAPCVAFCACVSVCACVRDTVKHARTHARTHTCALILDDTASLP